jgi:hypothetical protein
MKKKKEWIGPGKVIGGLIALCGAVTLFIGAWRVYNSYASLHWTKVDAKIISSGIAQYEKHNHEYYEPMVTYSYSYGSNSYVNSRIRFAPLFCDQEAAGKIVAQYPKGKSVTVYCKPSNPAASVLEPGAFPNTWTFAVMGMIILAIVGGIAGLYPIAKEAAADARAAERLKRTHPELQKTFKEELREEIEKEMEKVQPDSGPGIFSTIAWSLVAVFVFWFLGKWGTPLTVLGEILLLLFLVSVVMLLSQTLTVPSMKVLVDGAVSPQKPQPRDPLEAEIQALDFHYIGDFDPAMCPGKSDRIRAYVDADRTCGAAFMDIQTGRNTMSTVLEFSTSLHPSGSINTNNSRFPGLFAYRLDKMVAHAPWKTSASGLLKLHRLLCQVAQDEKFTPEAVQPGQFAQKVTQASLNDFEYQVGLGRYKKAAEGQYRTTLLGMLITVPVLWYLEVYGHLLFWFRLPDAFFCRKLSRRLRQLKAQSQKSDSQPR